LDLEKSKGKKSNKNVTLCSVTITKSYRGTWKTEPNSDWSKQSYQPTCENCSCYCAAS